MQPGNLSYVGAIGTTGENIPFALFNACINSPANPNYNFCMYTRNVFISQKANAMYVTIQLDIDPFTPEGTTWLSQARDYLDTAENTANQVSIVLCYTSGIQLTPDTPQRYYLALGASVSIDAMQAAYDVFTIAVGITMAVIFILMAIAFKSVLIPVRAVLSIALTLGLVFGLTTYVYQDGILSGLHWASLGNYGALVWITPVLALFVVTGAPAYFLAVCLISVLCARSGCRL